MCSQACGKIDVEVDGIRFCSNFDSGNSFFTLVLRCFPFQVLVSFVLASLSCPGNLKFVRFVSRSTSSGPLTRSYDLLINSDCEGTMFAKPSRLWFSFWMEPLLPNQTVCFCIRNMKLQTRLFSLDHRPVFKCCPTQPYWAR